MEKAADPAAEGRRICAELIEELSTIPGVAGVHLMAPNNASAIPDVIAAVRPTGPPRAPLGVAGLSARSAAAAIRSMHAALFGGGAVVRSLSSPSSPARMRSAMRPEFCRTAASILAAMSGLALRKFLAFSRPWPMRWLS